MHWCTWNITVLPRNFDIPNIFNENVFSTSTWTVLAIVGKYIVELYFYVNCTPPCMHTYICRHVQSSYSLGTAGYFIMEDSKISIFKSLPMQHTAFQSFKLHFIISNLGLCAIGASILYNLFLLKLFIFYTGWANMSASHFNFKLISENRMLNRGRGERTIVQRIYIITQEGTHPNLPKLYLNPSFSIVCHLTKLCQSPLFASQRSSLDHEPRNG